MSDSPVLDAMVDAKVRLGVLAQVSGGDFTARMPLEWTGLSGKVADGVNDLIKKRGFRHECRSPGCEIPGLSGVVVG